MVACNKHSNVYFVSLEEDEEEEEEIRGKMFPFDKLIIPGKFKISIKMECHFVTKPSFRYINKADLSLSLFFRKKGKWYP